MLIPTRYGAVLVTFLGNMNQGAPVWRYRLNDGRRAETARWGAWICRLEEVRETAWQSWIWVSCNVVNEQKFLLSFLGHSFKIESLGILSQLHLLVPFSFTHRSFRRGLARLTCGVSVAFDPTLPPYHSPNENCKTVEGCEKFEAKNRWEERDGRYTKRAKRVRLLWLAGFGPHYISETFLYKESSWINREMVARASGSMSFGIYQWFELSLASLEKNTSQCPGSGNFPALRL
jgi:hypothetical protein